MEYFKLNIVDNFRNNQFNELIDYYYLNQVHMAKQLKLRKFSIQDEEDFEINSFTKN